MSDADARKLVNSLKQPVSPTQPRPERGFIRNHFPHLRLSSHGDRKQRRASASASQAPTEVDGFALTQQTSDTLTDEDSLGDSMSAVLLANAQPLSQRSGSLDRPPSLQRSSLRLSGSSTPSKPLLDDTHEVQPGELNGLVCLDAVVESSSGAKPLQLALLPLTAEHDACSRPRWGIGRVREVAQAEPLASGQRRGWQRLATTSTTVATAAQTEQPHQQPPGNADC